MAMQPPSYRKEKIAALRLRPTTFKPICGFSIKLSKSKLLKYKFR